MQDANNIELEERTINPLPLTPSRYVVPKRTKIGAMACIAINIPCTLLILFLIQSAVGFGSSWLLLYTSGERVVRESVVVQQTAIFQTVLNNVEGFLAAPSVTLNQIQDTALRYPLAIQDNAAFAGIMGTLKRNYHPTSAFFFASKYNDFVWLPRDNGVFIAYGNRSAPPYSATSTTAFLHMLKPDFSLTNPLANFSIPIAFSSIWWFQERSNLTRKSWASNLGTMGGEISTHLAVPIYLNGTSHFSGEFYGVMGIDFSVTTMNQKLNESVATVVDTTAFILTEKNELIAISNEPIPLQRRPGDTEDSLIPASNHSNPLVSAIARAVQNNSSMAWTATTNQSQITVSTGTYDFAIREINDPNRIGWRLVVAVRTRDFLNAVTSSGAGVIWGSVAILVVGCLLVLVITLFISIAMCMISSEMRKLAKLSLETAQHTILNIIPLFEIRMMADSLSAMRRGLYSFQKYVPISIVRRIMKQQLSASIAMQEEQCTIMFIDIQNFTNIAESTNVSVVVDMLTNFFSHMSRIIEEHKGMVDKYLGDGIMALWNHPYEAVPDHAVQACMAALAMFAKAEELSNRWKDQKLPVFRIRIGVNSGSVLIGNIGSTSRLNFTAIGDNVNIASRLEALNKYFKTSILISGPTYAQVKDKCLCYFVGFVTLRGRTLPSEIYTLEKLKSNATEQEIAIAEQLELVRSYLVQDKHDMAKEICTKLVAQHSNLVHVKLLLEQMQMSENKSWTELAKDTAVNVETK